MTMIDPSSLHERTVYPPIQVCVLLMSLSPIQRFLASRDTCPCGCRRLCVVLRRRRLRQCHHSHDHSGCCLGTSFDVSRYTTTWRQRHSLYSSIVCGRLSHVFVAAARHSSQSREVIESDDPFSGQHHRFLDVRDGNVSPFIFTNNSNLHRKRIVFRCKLHHLLGSVGRIMSTFLITAMSFDRFVAVCLPMHLRLRSRRNVLLIITGESSLFPAELFEVCVRLPCCCCFPC